MANISIDSTITGDSTSTISGVFMAFTSMPYPGGSVLDASITWVSAPNAPTRLPSSNSGYNLQQFIDTLGPSRGRSGCEVVSSLMVNSYPTKRVPSPR
jgi:hypothetical protein